MNKIIALLCALCLTCACTPSPKENPVKTNPTELARLIKLPFPAKAVQWQVIQASSGNSGLGPQDWALVAVLDFSSQERGQLLKQPVRIDTSFPSTFVLPWFPAALRALWQTQSDGTMKLTATALDASAFYNSPLQNGYLLPFGDGGQVMLYLYTQ